MFASQHQKLDFSSAVGKFSSEPSSAKDWKPLIQNNVLFLCFTDPDTDSPTSGSPSFGDMDAELRCPHFRNKCGIKRLV